MNANEWLNWLQAYPGVHTLLSLCALVLAALAANWITKRVLVRGLQHLLVTSSLGDQLTSNHRGVIPRLANAIPALVVWAGISLVPGLPEAAVTVVKNVCNAFLIVTLALALSAVRSEERRVGKYWSADCASGA